MLNARSLYGRDDAPDAADVSSIAKMYGGGGHQAAAGMRAKVANVEEMFVDMVEEEDKRKARNKKSKL